MNDFIKEIAYLKCEHPNLSKQLDEILELVNALVEKEIFQGNVMLKELLKYHEKV